MTQETRVSLVFFKLFLLALSPLSSEALEYLPEFQSLTEEEQAIFEAPTDLGAEYQSDVMTYTKWARWEHTWLSHPHALDANIGSTGTRHFLIDDRLKVNESLSEHVEFRFTYLEERNRERDSTHHILELVFWPWKLLGISLYGEPTLYKRNDDTGIALLARPSEHHEIRIFNTFVDVTRLRRNDRNDTYVIPDLPYSRGLVGRWWSASSEEFFEYAARQETKTRWLFPDDGYEYRYWKWFASFFGRVEAAHELFLNGRFQVDRKFESRDPGEAWVTTRLFIIAQSEWLGIGPWKRWDLLFGLNYAARLWDTSLGLVRYRDFLPHLWLKLPTFGEEPFEDHFLIGFDSGWHRETGEPTLISPSDPSSLHDGSMDYRLNLEYEFNFGEKGKLRLIASGDLDKMFTRESWEGGSGQFQLLF